MFGLLKTGFSLFTGGNALVRIGAYVIAGAVVAGGVWLHGYMSGRAGADNKALRIKIARLEKALEASEQITREHNVRAEKDDAADQKNKELINETPENPLLCFDHRNIERLRQLR